MFPALLLNHDFSFVFFEKKKFWLGWSITNSSSDDGESEVAKFDDPASAAKAAAESAKQAIAAAEAAAYLASKDAKASSAGCHYSPKNATADNIPFISGAQAPKFSQIEVAPPSQSIVDLYDMHWSSKNIRNSENSHSSAGEEMPLDMKRSQKFDRRHSYNVPSSNRNVQYDDSDCDEEIEMEDPPSGTYKPSPPTDIDGGKFYRRHSYNVPSVHSGIKFDESDGEEEMGTHEFSRGTNRAPNRPAPHVPRVHPNLPDYDKLTARFESLKSQKSRRT